MSSLRLLLILLMLVITGIVSAQDEGDIYTFESGVHFTMPADASMDEDGAVPRIIVDETIAVEFVEPARLGDIAAPEQNSPLEDVLDLLLDNVGFTGRRTAAKTFTLKLDDGRDAVAFDFINASKYFQSVLVVRMSDGSIGALNVRSLKALTGAQRDTLLAAAASFDVGEAATSTASTVSDAEAKLMEGLTEEYAYESGVSFRYPDDYSLKEYDKPPISLSLGDEVFISVVDPNVVGIPPGRDMAAIIDFAVKNSTLDASEFEAFDIGGREAVVGSAPAGSSGDLLHTMVLVRFDDLRVGILDVVTRGPLTRTQLAQVRGIAASFNSAAADSSLSTQGDAAAADALYVQADKAYKAKDYEQAIDLYSQALDLHPDFGLAYYWRAAAYQHTGELEQALEGFRKALELAPEETQVHKDIVETLMLLDELDEALDEFETWIDASGSRGIGDDYTGLYALVKSIAAGKYDRNFYFRRADQLRQYGRFDEALRDNQTSLDNLPDDATLYAQRGVIYMDMKQYDDAIDAFTDGLRVELLPILFYDRGFAYQANFRSDPHALVDAVHDFQCVLLLADETLTSQQRRDAQRVIDTTMISDDSYAPITDAADCAA